MIGRRSVLGGLLASVAAAAHGQVYRVGRAPGMVAGLRVFGAGVTLYVGQVGSRSYEANNFSGVRGTTVTDRTMHYIWEDIGASNPMSVAYANYAVLTPSSNPTGAGAETASATALTFSCDVYDATGATKLGSLSFGGNASQTLAAGTPADAVGVYSGTIAAGTWIQLRPTCVAAAGANATAIPYTLVSAGAVESTALGDGPYQINGVTSVGAKLFPREIYANTRKVSVGIVGDSRQMAQGDIPTALGLTGSAARALGGSFAFIDSGVPSDRVAYWNASHTMRLARLARVSHVVIGMGFNDLNGGAQTAAQLQVLDQTMYTAISAVCPNIAYLTMEPYSTDTTSGWTSTGAQTAASLNTARATANAARLARSTAPYSAAFAAFDIAGQVETSTGSGIWKVGSNARTITGVSATNGSNILTSASAAFSSADIGTGFYLTRASVSKGNLSGFVIASVISGTQATLDANLIDNLTGETLKVGGLSRDGIHETPQGYALAATAITPSSFVRT